MLLSWIHGRDHYLGATRYSVRHIVIPLLAVRIRAGRCVERREWHPFAAADLSGSLPVLVPMLGGAAQLDVKFVAMLLSEATGVIHPGVQACVWKR